MLLKHCHHRQDAEGKAITLHTIRDKERHEIDVVLAEGESVTDMIEVELNGATPSASVFAHGAAQPQMTRGRTRRPLESGTLWFGYFLSPPGTLPSTPLT